MAVVSYGCVMLKQGTSVDDAVSPTLAPDLLWLHPSRSFKRLWLHDGKHKHCAQGRWAIETQALLTAEIAECDVREF